MFQLASSGTAGVLYCRLASAVVVVVVVGFGGEGIVTQYQKDFKKDFSDHLWQYCTFLLF